MQGQELWSTGKHTLNCYASAENRIVDKYYYIAEDVINHMTVVMIGSDALAAVAVQDKIRIIDNKGSMLYQTQLDAHVTCFDVQEAPTKNGFPLLIFGTKSGNIGAIELTIDEAIVLWETDYQFENKSIVTHVKVASLKDGVNNICLTRDDGSIEIYSFTER